eukprot:3211496-Amphidinium_carterae.1
MATESDNSMKVNKMLWQLPKCFVEEDLGLDPSLLEAQFQDAMQTWLHDFPFAKYGVFSHSSLSCESFVGSFQVQVVPPPRPQKLPL